MINGTFRVQMYTKQYEQMCRFYEDILQLPVLLSRETSKEDRVRVYGAASGQIELIYAPDRMELPESNGLTLQMQVEDVDAYCESIKKKGYTIKRGPQDQFWGHRNAKIVDPGGTELTIYSEIEGR